ncbi:hypothetical protein CQS04_02200 [Chryseomicrobium excrementi]|uniref:Uncharacterized protein n=1 Tax=Chryseomicrobium excrementi TaxID=2041346 RepID=A0A2M9F2M1_9BACL|nr:hypothetical protein [Chryseomicrobium excrementi]PJK17710.1 hypothetical protein CQS04_02200 [Chryseomicrobium excrementi]
MNANYKTLGVLVMSITLFLLLLGVGVLLDQPLTTSNVVTIIAYGLAAGLFAGALAFLNLKIGVIIFLIGLAIGFFEMFRSFLFASGEFGDLAGLLSLFIFTAFGLVLAVVVEGIRYFIAKSKPPTT